MGTASPMNRMKPRSDRRVRTADDLRALSFGERGLLPIVAQDASTREVLMVAYASQEALEQTLASGQMHYWSRSRQELWHKGATSGHVQEVVSLHADCDGDTVLALVHPRGPACHTGETTCFGQVAGKGAVDGEVGDESAPDPEGTLPSLWKVLEGRAAHRPAKSYTVRLLDDENLRMKKLGEELAELILALSSGDQHHIAAEGADLVYHLLVALLARDVTLRDLLDELDARKG